MHVFFHSVALHCAELPDLQFLVKQLPCIEGADTTVFIKRLLDGILNSDIPLLVKSDNHSFTDAAFWNKQDADKSLRNDNCYLTSLINDKLVAEDTLTPTRHELADTITKSRTQPTEIMISVLRKSNLPNTLSPTFKC